MDDDRIGLVLVKTSELRSKIVSCIHKTASNAERENGEIDGENHVDEEAESLLNIKDALESLEAHLSSLQALQQQQWYEKEAALSEIECCQKKLLKELKEYKGKDFQVIQEAMAFASETDETNDFLLPPYPTRPSQSILSKNGYISQRSHQNGGLKSLHNIPNNIEESESKQRQSGPFKSAKVLIGKAAKMAMIAVGLIAVLNLAGFEPRVRKRDNLVEFLDFFQWKRNCPPGKVLVFENGETRCVVKERVEVPFESVVAVPDVSYGCG